MSTHTHKTTIVDALQHGYMGHLINSIHRKILIW